MKEKEGESCEKRGGGGGGGGGEGLLGGWMGCLDGRDRYSHAGRYLAARPHHDPSALLMLDGRLLWNGGVSLFAGHQASRAATPVSQ